MNQSTNKSTIGALKHQGSSSTTPTPQVSAASSKALPTVAAAQSATTSASEQLLIAMWRETSTNSKAASLSQKNAKDLRAKLAEALFNYKKDLVGRGREGRWSAFLREAGIPLPTADRYVERHRKMIEPVDKLITEELSAKEIESLGKKICILLSRATSKVSRIALLERIDVKLHELRA